MADYGEKVAEDAILDITRTLKGTYQTAQSQLQSRLDTFVKKHEQRDRIKQQQRDSGQITEQQYKDWLSGQVFMRGQWEKKVDQVCKVMTDCNAQAMKVINERRLGVFAENYNSQAFKAEKETALSFEVYNTQAVARLLKDDPDVLPTWKTDEKKDYQWNKKKVNNVVAQGIIQGKSIDEIADDLSTDLAAQNESKMRSLARTAITGAQNAGRQEQMNDAADMGLKVHKRWIATLDSRTRDSHRDLDGQEVEYNEDFESIFGYLEYPGDPSGDPADVYNCRCTMITIYPEYSDGRGDRWHREEDLGEDFDEEEYERWKLGANKKEEKKTVEAQTRSKVVEGKDISATWNRRKAEFDFEIEDILNAQGYDGLPSVVSREEFDKAVQESSFVAQRTYTAPNKEALDAYRDQLYHGDWYVDCSTGGAQYGQGMYCAADYNGKLTDGIKAEMAHYQKLGTERYAEQLVPKSEEEAISYIKDFYKMDDTALKMARKTTYDDEFMEWMNKQSVETKRGFGAFKAEVEKVDLGRLDIVKVEAPQYTETFTLTRDAKIITYDNLYEDFNNYKRNVGTMFSENYVDNLTGYSDDFLTVLKSELNIGNVDRKATFEAYKRIVDSDEYAKMGDVLVGVRKGALKAEMDASDMNIGSYAALKGYDAINAEGHGESGSYTVILNRTKCIFLRGE